MKGIWKRFDSFLGFIEHISIKPLLDRAKMVSSVVMFESSIGIKSKNQNNVNPLVIQMIKDDVREKGEAMKEILKQYPGEKQVYLDVEGNKIKTSFSVSDDDQLIALLEDLIGNGCFTTL